MRTVGRFGLLVVFGACAQGKLEQGTKLGAGRQRARPIRIDANGLLAAEQHRDSSAIGADALSSRDVELRRTAARALARIADARSAEQLLPVLSDEDSQVCTWAAYGLGYTCRGREAKTVRALVARAASWRDTTASTALWSPLEAISDALGRCATPEAESTLRSWLAGPRTRADAAAMALGRLAAQSGKLEDASLVALLDAADGPAALQNALFPVTRLATLNESTAERARALALRLIGAHAPSSEFAVRVLARTGADGAAALGRLVAAADVAPALRAQAARELGTLAAAGQTALWAAFGRVFERAPSDVELQGAQYGPLSALLDGLSAPILGSETKLGAVAELALDVRDSPSLRRRKTHLRCGAAVLLAGSNFRNPVLLACDPAADSLSRELSVLRVIGRDRLRGARKQAYLERAHANDHLLRAAAIELLAEHGELALAYQVLSDGLTSQSLGVMASAAQVLASHPERAARVIDAEGAPTRAPNPDPSIGKALGQAYSDARSRNSIEVQSLLLDAIGALQILTRKDAANQACQSDNQTLREHAEKTLRLLGEQSRQCAEFKSDSKPSPLPATAPRSLITLETEVGNLTLQLDPSFAANAVARVVHLVQAGFYDGMAIHRVVPGFVAQFGDPSGDGYGGDDQAPLRCETSPLAFAVGAIGVALSGRDTGSSQLFVTLGRYPHLDGEYAWLGQAGPGWDRVAPGDRILHARVSSMP